MAQLSLHIGERFTLLQHQTGIGVSEAMGGKMERQRGLLQHVPHGASHFALIHRRACACTKHPGRPRRPALEERFACAELIELPQGFGKHLREIDGPAMSRFWRTHLTTRQGSRHAQLARKGVEILPLKCQRFAQPEAGARQGKE
jgi:hypothetical protein